MKTPETSRLFEKRTDPVSGVERYLLSPKLFRHQQGFYFCNDCMSADGRYLWFCIGMRPGEDRLLAVVDFERDEAYVLEDTLSAYASPYIDTETGEAYFLWKNTIYRRHPAPEAQSEALVTLKTDAPACHIATHLTRSSDKKKFFLDILDANGDAWCLEVNTLPGMTPNSLIPKAAAVEGMTYPELCEKIIELSLKK